MTDLDKLIEAVEAGTALPDGMQFPQHSSARLNASGLAWLEVFGDNVGYAICTYDGSLDAFKALHDALLPGHFWFIGHLDAEGLGYAATVSSGGFPDSPSWRGYDMCPARAGLLAILKAHRSQVQP